MELTCIIAVSWWTTFGAAKVAKTMVGALIVISITTAHAVPAVLPPAVQWPWAPYFSAPSALNHRRCGNNKCVAAENSPCYSVRDGAG